ncbi:TPA: tape measure protein, partial [Streptococcus pneumoniae]
MDVGRVMQQISAQGKVTGEDMAQMADAGVNATKYLADSMGMSQADVKKAISDGKISFEDFVTAINKGTGSLAKDMGQTLPAKIANFKTSLSAFGATLLEPMIGPMTKAVEFLTGVFKGLNQPIKDFVTWLGEGSLAADAFKGVMIVVGGVVAGAVSLMAVGALASLGSMIGGFVLGGLQATITGAKMVAAAWTTVAGWARAAGAMAIQVAKMIGQWVMLGGQALVQAGRVAAAWIMAAPKNLVQYTIAFVQIIAGWVRMAAVATVQAIKAGAAWIIAAPKNLGTYARAFGAMIAGWGQAAGAAIVNAGRIAGAWIIAAPKNLGAGVKALGMIAGGWVRAGIAAVANAAVIAGSWLVAMWPVALVIAAIVGIIGVFKLLWDNVAGFREFWQGVWDGLVNVVATA